MSQREYDKFQQMLRDDPQIAEWLRKRIAEAGETNKVDVTVQFANNHGYKVDAKDVRSAL